MGVKTRALYKKADKEGLRKLIEDYALLIKRLNIFHKLFQAQWMKENKPFGFEIQDLRLGGLIRRVESCRRRLKNYCSGKIMDIPELNEEILPFFGGAKDLCLFNQHMYIASVNVPTHRLVNA